MSSTAHPANIVIAYIPVLHRGYLELFRKWGKGSTLLILGSDLLTEVDYLRKELRAITPEEAAKAVGAMHVVRAVTVVHKPDLERLNNMDAWVCMPDEDVSHIIAERYLNRAHVTFKAVFLRWNRANVDQPRDGTAAIESVGERDMAMMREAYEEASRSPDIWRHVGAVLVHDDKEIARASNQPLTTQNTPWAEGDPRTLFNRGAGIAMSTFMHAEARLIADAAKSGTKLAGMEIYVTTFPCPPCAMLIAQSGIRRCIYTEGYAVLDGARVLRENGVELVHVPMDDKPLNSERLVLYPEQQS